VKLNLIKDSGKTFTPQFFENNRMIGINIPKSLIPKEFLDQNGHIEKCLSSENLKILICGRLIIQLRSDISDIQSIGCFIYKKDHSVTEYRFYDLMNKNDKKIIFKYAKSPHLLKNIVKFTNE
jgi:hypothetical protein